MENKIIAFYLPQFHPIAENEKWWGKGFTEWTNVGNAKPLFPGHYQPRVPKDLGYYDLRVKDIAEAQSRMALDAGISGFMYWHYWFGNGRKIMEMPITNMLNNKNIKIPFSLCWANHSWYAKNWNAGASRVDKLLIEQQYLGKEDYKAYFYDSLKYFRDERYILIDNKPLFGLYQPYSVPDIDDFIDLWNQLARENGFDGIFFMAFNSRCQGYEKFRNSKYDICAVDCVADSKYYGNKWLNKVYYKICRMLKFPEIVKYDNYVRSCLEYFEKNKEVVPCIVPNYDHTPRSKRAGMLLHKSTPQKWGDLLAGIKKITNSKDRNKTGSNLVFIKAWNEWAEGNYLEPDLVHGLEYLNQIKKVFN